MKLASTRKTFSILLLPFDFELLWNVRIFSFSIRKSIAEIKKKKKLSIVLEIKLRWKHSVFTSRLMLPHQKNLAFFFKSLGMVCRGEGESVEADRKRGSVKHNGKSIWAIQWSHYLNSWFFGFVFRKTPANGFSFPQIVTLPSYDFYNFPSIFSLLNSVLLKL